MKVKKKERTKHVTCGLPHGKLSRKAGCRHNGTVSSVFDFVYFGNVSFESTMTATRKRREG